LSITSAQLKPSGRLPLLSTIAGDSIRQGPLDMEYGNPISIGPSSNAAPG
jgi:hypothetical protein